MHKTLAVSWKAHMINRVLIVLKKFRHEIEISCTNTLLYLKKDPWYKSARLGTKRTFQDNKVLGVKKKTCYRLEYRHPPSEYHLEHREFTRKLIFNAWIHCHILKSTLDSSASCFDRRDSPRIWDSQSKNLDIFWGVGTIQTRHTWNAEHSPWNLVLSTLLCLEKYAWIKCIPLQTKRFRQHSEIPRIKVLIYLEKHIWYNVSRFYWGEFSKELRFRKK